MATPKPVQESIITGAVEACGQADYYDIMIIGHTGQGKSTTSDKLLIANPEGIRYTPKDPVMSESDKNRLDCGNLSLWMANAENLSQGSVQDHLEALVRARTKLRPNEEVNFIRDSIGNDQARTTDCELFSNDTTGVRVLDVPGFFDEESDLESGAVFQDVFRHEFAILRKIIIVQTRMGLKFKKILYFLPVRGALKRAGAVIRSELKILMHYFGESILKKIVLVATNQERLSLGPDGDSFPDEERDDTMRSFKKCLLKLEAYDNEADIPQIPLICISLSETCESILEKVKLAPVTGEEIWLQFNPKVCMSCGNTTGFFDGIEMICYIDETNKVPYNESTCHPLFIPDLNWYQKIFDTLVRFVTRGRESLAHRFNVREKCIGCEREPGSEACMQVGRKIYHEGKEITCDHKFPTTQEAETLL